MQAGRAGLRDSILSKFVPNLELENPYKTNRTTVCGALTQDSKFEFEKKWPPKNLDVNVPYFWKVFQIWTEIWKPLRRPFSHTTWHAALLSLIFLVFA